MQQQNLNKGCIQHHSLQGVLSTLYQAYKGKFYHLCSHAGLLCSYLYSQRARHVEEHVSQVNYVQFFRFYKCFYVFLFSVLFIVVLGLSLNARNCPIGRIANGSALLMVAFHMAGYSTL